jgi:hypothetical protein
MSLAGEIQRELLGKFPRLPQGIAFQVAASVASGRMCRTTLDNLCTAAHSNDAAIEPATAFWTCFNWYLLGDEMRRRREVRPRSEFLMPMLN